MREQQDINEAAESADIKKEELSDIQKKIEDKIAQDEQSITGAALSEELSKDRTHMSEHRTEMSEHRTGLSEHRTELSDHRTGLSEQRTGLSEHRTELSEHRTGLSEKRTGLSDERTVLSYQRTALSYERTLMSWIRTATSLISFGFTIYKVFDEFQKANPEPRLLTPRIVGMIMILFGFVGLLFAQLQHQVAYKKLAKSYPEAQRSLSSVLSILILVFGLLLFLAALLRQ